MATEKGMAKVTAMEMLAVPLSVGEWLLSFEGTER